MFALNGSGRKIVKMLQAAGLNEYQSKTYYTLLVEGKSKAWDLSTKSSVPHSKIYYAVAELEEKGLAYTVGSPMIIYPTDFGQYLDAIIKQKRKEIRKLVEIGHVINRSAYSLKSGVKKIRSRYQVFEKEVVE